MELSPATHRLCADRALGAGRSERAEWRGLYASFAQASSSRRKTRISEATSLLEHWLHEPTFARIGANPHERTCKCSQYFVSALVDVGIVTIERLIAFVTMADVNGRSYLPER